MKPSEIDSDTLVIPMTAMLELIDVVPFPVPHAPASRDPRPSASRPLFTAALVGSGAADSL